MLKNNDDGSLSLLDSRGTEHVRLGGSTPFLPTAAGDARRYGVVGDGVTDDTAAINKALANSNHVVLPPGTYKTTGAITIPAGATLEGIGTPTIHYYGTTSSIGVVQTGGADAALINVVIDGGATNNPITPFATYCVYIQHDRFYGERIKVQNYRNIGIYFKNCNHSAVRHAKVPVGTGGPALELDGTSFCVVQDVDTTAASGTGTNFGCYLTNSANRNLLRNLRCQNDNTVSTRTLELIGITYTCWGNRVEGCHAEGTGDNGISVTGYCNVVVGNVAKGNYNHGICVYGRNNVVTGNMCWNNSQSGAGLFPNIGVRPEFGGEARDNAIVGNTCIDDQASPTAKAPVEAYANKHNPWVSGNTWTSSNRYCYNGANVYAGLALTGTPSTAGGTGTATAPTHTSGTVNDSSNNDGIAWTYLFTASPSNIGAHGNTIVGNTGRGHLTTDGPQNSSPNPNTFVGKDLSTYPQFASFLLNESTGIGFYSGTTSPSGNVSAPTGSLYFRQNANFGLGLYTKESGAGNTGWNPVKTRLFGTAANAPSTFGAGYQDITYYVTDYERQWVWRQDNTWGQHMQDASFTTAGRPTTTFKPNQYVGWDTTINKAIWRNSANTGFVDAMGTAV
jgi:hypothetical protein